MSSSLRRGLACALLAVCAAEAEPAADAEPFRFLHVVPTRAEPGWAPGRPAELVLVTPEPAALAEQLGADAVLAVGEGEVRVRLDPSREPAGPPPGPAQLASSFLVDHGSEAVQELVASRGGGGRPTPEELVEWVRDAVEPAMDRGFDAASVVARKGRGDCSEYAVLYAALARHHGYPARIALGLVLAEGEGGAGAFGHAWTELWDGERWRRVDPTPFEGGEPFAYLTTGRLGDEGPGYVVDLVRSGSQRIRAVRILPRR